MTLQLESAKIPQNALWVIFGLNGDLAKRKLLPALYHLMQTGHAPEQMHIIGVGRTQHTTDAVWKEELAAQLRPFIPNWDTTLWHKLCKNLYYQAADVDSVQAMQQLQKKVVQLEEQHHLSGLRLFYLATSPRLFPSIVQNIKKVGLCEPYCEGSQRQSRVIIEKPFGHDLTSARALQNHLSTYLAEEQIYRIDHYLGKETVQNLMVFRFGNHIFESLWNNHHIASIEITMSETLGIGSRAPFYEEAGQLRDVMQNHMMQLLSLIAMEPPTSMAPSAIQDEKVKVLSAIPVPKTIPSCAVRGQYSAGGAHAGYLEEKGVDPQSRVETFAATKLFVDNWRWSGVPFYLRTGKRMQKQATQIIIEFKKTPGICFRKNSPAPNRLILQIQPNEGMALSFNTKKPGIGAHTIDTGAMHFSYESLQSNVPEAYERLLHDAMVGDSTLFARADEALLAWKIVTPILEYWKEDSHLPRYPAGSNGPQEAALLLENGYQWFTT